MRKNFGPSNPEADPYFRWRGGDVGRLEGLSDGIFALAIAMLAIGNVPRDHDALVRFFQDVPAFALCFLFLMWCWWNHFKFSRRYGLQDMTTVVFNALLLFVVLFFVNPLGYVAHVLITRPFFGLPHAGQGEPGVMLWYAAGFTLIFLCFLIMNLNAWSRREDFELDAVERALAKTAIGEHVINVSVGLVSVISVLAGIYMLAGWVFMSLSVLHGFYGWRRHVATHRVLRETRGPRDVGASSDEAN